MSSGFKDLKVMKTTQSGFEDFIVDEYTTLQVLSALAYYIYLYFM